MGGSYAPALDAQPPWKPDDHDAGLMPSPYHEPSPGPWTPVPTPDQATLDAMQRRKGGGKKGQDGKPSKGPLICNTCGGVGHPFRLCPSPVDAKEKGGPACGNCGGAGHTAAMCPSQGGGKYVPRDTKGKGNGKGGKDRSQHFYGKGSGAQDKKGLCSLDYEYSEAEWIEWQQQQRAQQQQPQGPAYPGMLYRPPQQPTAPVYAPPFGLSQPNANVPMQSPSPWHTGALTGQGMPSQSSNMSQASGSTSGMPLQSLSIGGYNVRPLSSLGIKSKGNKETEPSEDGRAATPREEAPCSRSSVSVPIADLIVNGLTKNRRRRDNKKRRAAIAKVIEEEDNEAMEEAVRNDEKEVEELTGDESEDSSPPHALVDSSDSETDAKGASQELFEKEEEEADEEPMPMDEVVAEMNRQYELLKSRLKADKMEDSRSTQPNRSGATRQVGDVRKIWRRSACGTVAISAGKGDRGELDTYGGGGPRGDVPKAADGPGNMLNRPDKNDTHKPIVNDDACGSVDFGEQRDLKKSNTSDPKEWPALQPDDSKDDKCPAASRCRPRRSTRQRRGHAKKQAAHLMGGYSSEIRDFREDRAEIVLPDACKTDMLINEVIQDPVREDRADDKSNIADGEEPVCDGGADIGEKISDGGASRSGGIRKLRFSSNGRIRKVRFHDDSGAKAVLSAIDTTMQRDAEAATADIGAVSNGMTSTDATRPHVEQHGADVDIAHSTTGLTTAQRDFGDNSDGGRYVARAKSAMLGVDSMPLGVPAMPNADKSLNILTIKERNPLSVVQPAPEWMEIEITIDSGACDTVMPENMCPHISLLSSDSSRAGLEYEVANGEGLPNLGEKKCLMMTEDSDMMKRVIFQCADVHKALLSVSRVADLGYECVFGKNGGQLRDVVTGDVVSLHRRGNLYVMRAWVKQDTSSTPGFGRPE